jgi:hypothetical protein
MISEATMEHLKKTEQNQGLLPFKDSKGIFQITSRVRNFSLKYEEPIVADKRSTFVTNMLIEIHKDYLHSTRLS